MSSVSLGRRASRVMLCVFCLYHMAATLVVNLPEYSPFGSELRAPFNPYVQTLGIWQNWAMFTTIPYYGSIRPVLVAQEPGGKTTDYGPMLPGLAPYTPRTRLASMIYRFVWPSDDVKPYADEYLRRACREIQRRAGKRPTAVGLRLDAQRLVSLDEMRRTGRATQDYHELSREIVACP